VPRPCQPTHCSPHDTPRPPCTTAPPEIIQPPLLRGALGCTYLVFTGHGCTECSDNYCTRSPLPEESAVVKCPLGFLSQTGPRRCLEYWCGRPDRLPACPLTPPRLMTDPSTTILFPDCFVMVGTGAPCVGCPLYCTISGHASAIGNTRCDGELTVITTDRICAERTCVILNSPTPCRPERTTIAPWTNTYGCNVFVQTGEPCSTCIRVCTTPPNALPPISTTTRP
jgi:hypothetical protein